MSLTPETKESFWQNIAAGDHAVQFYQSDEALIQELGAFVSVGLAGQDTCIVLASAEHRLSLVEYLRSLQVNVDTAVNANRLRLLDAEDMLSKFMLGHSPNRALFNDTVGNEIRSANQPIRAFGEMVAILWEQGNELGALQLEKLWNELAAQNSFRLYCAYPHSAVSDNPAGRERIAHLHTKSA